MKTAIVILNWNTSAYLRRWVPCILESISGMDAELVVADNASSDDSLAVMAAEFPDVRTINLDRNYGFTGGYNRALSQVDAEYFLLMNSDIEVSGNWLEPLVSWMDSHPRCGVCGPALHKLEDNGGISVRTDMFEYAGAAGGYLDSFGFPYCRGRVLKRCEKDSGQYGNAGVLWVSGACLMTRRSVWESLGGLDERFFAHMEEIDYCWRAQLAGYTVEAVTESCVWHLGGGTLAQTSPFKLKLNYRNNLLMLEKNLPATVGRSRSALVIAVRRMLDLASALIYLFQGRRDYAAAVFHAHREVRGLRDAPAPGMPAAGGGVAGFGNICIILQSLIRGERIFKYLKDHENSH